MRPSITRSLVVLLLLAACASSSRVDLSGTWPERPGDYDAAVARWTRKESIHTDLDHVMSVAATALSADFRAAYVSERVRRLDMSIEERDALVTAEKTAASETIEFEILFATNKSEWNDLAKYPRSMWRVALVGDDGREVLPSKIVPDRRVRAEIEQWFPDFGPFYKAYVVTFPRMGADGKPVLSETSKRMALELGSAVGKTRLVWSAE